jgi:hypothetical protein
MSASKGGQTLRCDLGQELGIRPSGCATRGRGGSPSRPPRRTNHAAFFSLLVGSLRENGRLGDPALPSLSLNSEVEQVVLVLLLVLVLENSHYLTVTLIERSSAGRFGPCFDAGSQQIEHEHDSLTSESGLSSNSFHFHPKFLESPSSGCLAAAGSLLPAGDFCGLGG